MLQLMDYFWQSNLVIKILRRVTDFEIDLKKGKVLQVRMFLEKKSIDFSVVDIWVERFLDICRSYEFRDRFNADEIGFLGKVILI